ncbi:MAG: GNAT family N-acetyltransferase [Oscillospiraceae bacterium]|nr:GNAT family N-acetyltransferase [Oscillospiraceae bacterium]MCR5806239.1 GNAT family N-acetyltransferase [Oscillospiraceae bacterium]
MIYRYNETVSAEELSDLREAVGWNRLEKEYSDPRMTSYYHIAVYDENKMIGYIDSVSNGVTDAYIQDLTVHPAYQGKGIGTELMDMMIKYLKEQKIYMISVVFEKALEPFYKRFGFYTDMLCGQMETGRSEQ